MNKKQLQLIKTALLRQELAAYRATRKEVTKEHASKNDDCPCVSIDKALTIWAHQYEGFESYIPELPREDGSTYFDAECAGQYDTLDEAEEATIKFILSEDGRI